MSTRVIKKNRNSQEEGNVACVLCASFDGKMETAGERAAWVRARGAVRCIARGDKVAEEGRGRRQCGNEGFLFVRTGSVTSGKGWEVKGGRRKGDM